MARQGAAAARLDRRARPAPELAAREIDRVGDHPGFVQVLLPARSEHPYGSRLFHPLWEAIARHDLVAGIHFGGAPGNPPTPSGWPSYYFEEYAGMAQVFQSQLTSMISEGVFDQFPTLRVTLLESGFTWLPAHMWRFDKEWRNLRRLVPWVKRAPSEYIREHVRLTVQPLERAADARRHDADRRPAWLRRHAAVRQRLSAPARQRPLESVSAPSADALARQDQERERAGLVSAGATRRPQSRRFLEVTRMATTLTRTGTRPARTKRALVDCDFHNELDSIKDLYPYLSQRWRDHIKTYGTRGPAGATTRASWTIARMRARRPGARSGSEVAFSRTQFLDPYNVAYATLIPLHRAGAAAEP